MRYWNIPVTLARTDVYTDIPVAYARPVALASNIRELRKAARLTQIALGKRLGVGQGAVSKWESGETEPDASLLPSLALTLGTYLDVLLYGVDSHYDAERDLLRHSADQQSALLPGGAGVPATARRITELESELAAFKARWGDVQDVARALFEIAIGDKGRAAARATAGRRRTARKTG